MGDNKKEPANVNREKVIVRTSFLGIGANIVLAAFKAVVGLAANSIAIILDAVNNLSDALSSVITIIGTKLAGKAPDKKHPLGYGRIEYMSQMIVAAIVLYAGVTSLVESIKKIIHPEEADYSTLSLVIVAAAVVVKLILGTYVKKKGKEVNSGALVASGSDALFDAILSVSVLASAVIFLLSGLSLEAYVGVIISVFIIKSGIEMISEAVNEILGSRVSSETSKAIKKTVAEDPDVHGAYDLLLNNYGPDRYVGSVHVEVDDTLTAVQIDEMTRRIQERVYDEHHIILSTVGVYSVDTKGGPSRAAYDTVRQIVMSHEGVLQLHGFYFNEELKKLRFDMIVDFAQPDRHGLYQHVMQDIKDKYPDFDVQVTLDVDVSD